MPRIFEMPKKASKKPFDPHNFEPHIFGQPAKEPNPTPAKYVPTLTAIKDLKARTGAELATCKDALTKFKGDLDRAAESLRTFETIPSAGFLKKVLTPRKVHYQSSTRTVPLASGEDVVSRFVMSLHTAFDKHIPFSISPEVVLTIISQEIAQYVKDHSTDKKVACLFTTTPEEKPELIVEVHDFTYDGPNNWLGGIEKFRGLLVEKVPSNVMGLMTPKLSTETEISKLVHLIAFMDAASKFYQYGCMTCCGIPSFRLEGTAQDWDQLIGSVRGLNEILPMMGAYFVEVTKILTEIRNTVDGNEVNVDFWDSIYKINGGSGGPFANGWFSNLYAHDYDPYRNTATLKAFDGKGRWGGYKLNEFPSNISKVPFTWYYYEQKIPMAMAGGVTEVAMEGGFLTPKLGVLVIETIEEK